ncbi:CvpA family protein [Kiritimatiellota bacterium B12222]|nr:CvpA family protein [Kiritimatiellota bacterium B12222]
MDALAPFLDYLKDPETPFGIFDLVYGIVFLFGFIRGVFRGLPEELSQLLGSVVVLVGSIKLYQPVSAFIIEHTRLEDPTSSKALAYLLLFLLLMIVWKVITFLIRKTLDWSCPKQIKALGGGLVGMIKCAVFVVVILGAVLITGYNTLTQSMVLDSWFGNLTLQILPDTLSLTPESESDQEDSPALETEQEATDGSGNA